MWGENVGVDIYEVWAELVFWRQDFPLEIFLLLQLSS